MEIDFNFEGFPETLRAIDALPGLLGARVQGDGLIAAARVARDEARKLVPVRTGALQRTIRARRVSQLVYTARGRHRMFRARRLKSWPVNRDAPRGAERGRR